MQEKGNSFEKNWKKKQMNKCEEKKLQCISNSRFSVGCVCKTWWTGMLHYSIYLYVPKNLQVTFFPHLTVIRRPGNGRHGGAYIPTGQNSAEPRLLRLNLSTTDHRQRDQQTLKQESSSLYMRLRLRGRGGVRLLPEESSRSWWPGNHLSFHVCLKCTFAVITATASHCTSVSK